jgi:hypothetical protein
MPPSGSLFNPPPPPPLVVRIPQPLTLDPELMSSRSAYCTLLLSLLCFLDVSPPLHVAQWVTGGILLSASFPVAQAMVYVVFSRRFALIFSSYSTHTETTSIEIYLTLTSPHCRLAHPRLSATLPFSTALSLPLFSTLTLSRTFLSFAASLGASRA